MNFGAGIAGAGGAAAEEANKYIDQNLAIARAQALADISRTSAVQQHQQIDAYDLSPDRQAQMRTNATAATVAQGQAADTVAFNTAANAPLNEAKIAQHNTVTRATTGADVEREGAMDAAKVQKLPPGDKSMQGGRVIAENTNPTMADVWASGQRTNAGEARDQAVSANLTGINNELRDTNKQVLEGMRDGSMSMAPKDSGNPNDPKDTPYQTYRFAAKRIAELQIERERVNSAYAAERAARSKRPSEAAPASDPLGVRGVSAGPSGNGADKPSVSAAFPQVDTKDGAAAAAQLEAFAAKPGTDAYSARVATQEAQDIRRTLGSPPPDAPTPKSSAADAPPAPPPPAPGGIAAAAKGAAPTTGPTWQEMQRRMNGGAPDANATTTAQPAQTAAQAAAAPPPPSAILQAARRTSGHDAAKAEQASDIERRRAYLAQLPMMFDKDLATLPPLDFAQKYDPLRTDLDARRMQMLQRVEAQVR